MDQLSTPSSIRRLHLTGSRDPGPTLGFDQPDPNPNLRDGCQNVFATLSDYLQPDSIMSLDSAIQHTAHHCREETVDPFAVYGVSMVLGDQIPFDHAAQRKLGQFLVAVYESAEWSSIAQRKLESVDRELAEDYIDPAGRFEDGEDPMDFVNGSAFIANVIACDESSNLTRLVMPALGHIMDGALSDHSNELCHVADAWVMGAAQHIILCRAKLWELTMKADHPALVRLREKFEGLAVDDDDPNSCLWAFAGSGERDSKRRFKRMREDIYSAGSEKWPYTWEQWAAGSMEGRVSSCGE